MQLSWTRAADNGDVTRCRRCPRHADIKDRRNVFDNINVGAQFPSLARRLARSASGNCRGKTGGSADGSKPWRQAPASIPATGAAMAPLTVTLAHAWIGWGWRRATRGTIRASDLDVNLCAVIDSQERYRMERLLLTPIEAARQLGIGRSKLYELMKSGNLPSVRIGACRRIAAEELSAFVASLQTSDSDAVA